MNPLQVKDITHALNIITGGRLSEHWDQIYSRKNPYIVMKSSGLPGKAIMETPGMVYGDPDHEIKKIAVVMTLTEQVIELAGGTEVDAIIAHHPVADAASSGGVLLKTYLDLYNISVFELHEAFHGLHPGMAYIHGHVPMLTETECSGVPGRIYHVGKALKEIRTLGDLLDRIVQFSDWETESALLETEKEFRGEADIYETNVTVCGEILLGQRQSPVSKILHVFPHTGFDAEDLENVVRKHNDIDTVVASVSRVRKDHPLVKKCEEFNLNFLLGTSHAIEILENGIPLAKALASLLPGIDVVLFRQKVFSYPLHSFGTKILQEYGDKMSSEYLTRKQRY